MLTIHDISHTYPAGTRALCNVTLEVPRGTCVGIVGPNGSGKTTLIKVMAGLLPPTEGRVQVDAQPFSSLAHRARAKLIAYVPQETVLPFDFSVLEYVLMGRAPHLGVFAFEGARDLEIAHEALQATDTAHFTRRAMHELSGGERQRVILARALTQEAPLMLLDEPTSMLDIRHQVEFYRLLTARCRDRGLTAVTTLHDLNLAALFCDRVALMCDGQVVAYGPPREVFTAARLKEVFAIELAVMVRGSSQIPVIIPSLLE